jgi:hypothetical protein
MDEDDTCMRHRVRQRVLTLVLAIAAVTLTVPLWAALSPDGHVRRTSVVDARLRLNSPPLPQPLAEAGSLLVTGGLLIGLASVIRRTS